MKTAIAFTLALLAPSVYAQGGLTSQSTLRPATTSSEVAVNSVEAKIVGETGFPSVHVLVTATFGNSCVVPKDNELQLGLGYRDQYDTLALTLLHKVQRICPMNYAPVTVTIDLGTYTRPDDGLFSKVIVNGVTTEPTH